MTDSQTDPGRTTVEPAQEIPLRDRLLVWLGALLAILLFYAAAWQFGIPARPGFSASLLQQPNVGVAVVITALVFAACVVIGSMLIARVHRDGGLFAACVGLAVLSARGGPVRYVLFEASGRSVYLMLAGETILLGAMLAGAWIALDRFVPAALRRDPQPGEDAPQKYFSTIITALLMITLMSLLAQTDDKGQVICAVALSALLATLAGNWFAPASPSPWLWAAPLLVGLVGYVANYFSPAGIDVGRTSGYFAALARPLPLDYASAGVAGSLMGYWISARWHAREANSKAASGDLPAVAPGRSRD